MNNQILVKKKKWARRISMPWFRAYMTTSLYKHSRLYSSYQLNIGSVAFKCAFVTHRNAVTNAVEKTFETVDFVGREQEEMFKEDLERKLTWCLCNSFYKNRENAVNSLP